MDESTLNEISRDFMAVLFGVLTAIGAALLLLPVVNLIAGSHFQLSVFPQSLEEAWRESLLTKVALFLWLFASSIAGGTICTLIAANRDIILVLISSLVSIALVFILSGGEVVNRKHLIISIVIILAIPIGNVVGAGFGWNLKRRKKKIP